MNEIEKIREFKRDQRRKARLEAKRRNQEALAAGTANVTHGNVSTYIHYGCRCDLCRRANTDRTLEANEYRAVKRLLGAELSHGKPSTYANHGCRCDECRKAWSEACKDYYQRRKARTNKETL